MKLQGMILNHVHYNTLLGARLSFRVGSTSRAAFECRAGNWLIAGGLE